MEKLEGSIWFVMSLTLCSHISFRRTKGKGQLLPSNIQGIFNQGMRLKEGSVNIENNFDVG